MVENRARIRELLAELENSLDGLREKQGVPRERYVADVDIQDIVERRLEKATQTCLDIGRLVGRLEGRDLHESTNAGVFVELVDLGVLPRDYREEFIDIGGLRNVLAHQYRDINADEIYDVYHDLERLERFSESIYRYVHDEQSG